MNQPTKIFRDPIYGYIEIPADIVHNIIDSPAFQRLRRIVQTTYSPLYASALHNRFVHSLGVYHLGAIASNRIVDDIKNISDEYIWTNRYKEIFNLACLLHDVGHAPFSHTGEEYYLDIEDKYKHIHSSLVKLVGSQTFTETISQLESCRSAAPHEIMSAIIALRQFPEFFEGSDEKEFFARCITGYKYESNTEDARLKNCFITLLNSSVIDVDKLDYLIRDAYTTGFNTVNIDYNRLLTSITLIKIEDDYAIGYTKRAISVIENVVYARDSEKKWIQTHPAVMYESYLLNNAMRIIEDNAKENKIKFFSEESLLQDGESVRLLSDDDIIYRMKSLDNELCKEFFDRRLRRHPIWKSEAEYRNICLEYVKGGELRKKFETAMKNTAQYLSKKSKNGVINIDTIEELREDISKCNLCKDNESRKSQLENLPLVLNIMMALHDFAKNKNIECDYVILEASQFKSGFGNEDFSNIPIILEDTKLLKDRNNVTYRKFSDIVPSLKPDNIGDSPYYYIYYRRRKEDKNLKEEEKCEMRDELFRSLIGKI